VRQLASLVVAAAVAAAVLGPGCEGPAPATAGQLLLSWSFADGRTCSEAGVPSVYVGSPAADSSTRLDCSAGRGQAVDAGRFLPGSLDVEAVSASGAPLYRGRAEMPAADPAVVSVVLVFVGGAPPP
jgi:hypothetical protein